MGAGGAGAGVAMGTGAAATTGAGATGAGGTTTTTGTGNTNAVSVPLGLIGDTQTLHLFVSRVPRGAVNARGNDQPPAMGDTRRISYWLVGDANNGGLAKQEIGPITSDDATNNLPPAVDNENSFIIADEVVSLTFSYWDGTNWNDTWDSTQPGTDGVTPIGPPLAVSIEIGLPGTGGRDAPVKIYRHVVSVITANGATPQSSSTTGGGTTSP
jgi:hypothetical protein